MSSGSCSGTSDNLPHYPGVLGCIRQSNIEPHPLIIDLLGPGGLCFLLFMRLLPLAAQTLSDV